MRIMPFGDFLACVLLATGLGLSAYSAWIVGQPSVALPAILLGGILLAWRFWPRKKVARPSVEEVTSDTSVAHQSAEPQRSPSRSTPPLSPPAPSPACSTSPSDRLVAEMIAQGREVLLLRPQIAANLDPEQLERAQTRLDEVMAIVPQGPVVLRSWEEDEDSEETLVDVEAYYLDRYPVTNRQYKAFVDAGGYEQMSLWDEEIWPAVLEFVDETGHPGPRFWQQGSYPRGLDDHPVVGISWYEAAAYARWVGKRLPTDPEWVKAGAWPVVREGGVPVQRRFPWGDSMDRDRAHLWSPDVTGTVPVDATPGGQSVGGIHQLVGNVWEWTSSPFAAWERSSRFLNDKPLKSIRGGAFDTYFDCQASCQFQSGEDPLARKHNIGFRCAVGVCDVEPVGWGPSDAVETPLLESAPERALS